MHRTNPPLRLSKSPLLLVLAQIRFSSVLKMEQFLPEIQEGLRTKGFPKLRISKRNTATQVVGTDQVRSIVETYWEFAGRDDQVVAILGAESLSLTTTSYVSFEGFQDQLATVMNAVQRTAQIALRERIGLRYIDVIIPAQGKEVSDYVVSELLGISLDELGVTPAAYSSALVCRSGIGTLLLRCSRQSKGSVVPQDLSALKIKTNKPLVMEREFCSLDFDHFNEGTKDFDVEQTLRDFEELHDLIDQTFRRAVQPTALREWE